MAKTIFVSLHQPSLCIYGWSASTSVLETARNPKLEVFDSKDVSNIAREWDFISFEQNSSLTDQN